ncbi:Zinc finger CCCH domain-containing protein 51 [Cardamine amara subsp. amara]|uniref:Zinc finger CCCH domain-containing protein 51 n=1 Tax=Cardamine amara subsp. amara TaxID=228776 RepID=A0ABD0ZU12_CARAN
MSDSGEPETSVQESQLAEQEDEMPKSWKKRMLDEDSKNESSRLKNPKKVAKRTSRKLEADFEPAVLPLDCSICKRPFLDPVVTNCYHYFCKKCALKRHTENNKCFVCNEPTLGVFSTAVEVKQRIAETQKEARAMVKEVSAMLEKASAMVDDARVISEKAAKMVEEVEIMVEKAADMAMTAEETATKAAKMVREADITMETAKAKMVKALALTKTVMWTV